MPEKTQQQLPGKQHSPIQPGKGGRAVLGGSGGALQLQRDSSEPSPAPPIPISRDDDDDDDALKARGAGLVQEPGSTGSTSRESARQRVHPVQITAKKLNKYKKKKNPFASI